MKRILLAVAVAYVANALLVAATEQALHLMASHEQYLGADVLTQCAIQIVCGYLCARISSNALALIALIAVGLLVGSVSVAETWDTDPHWYAIALLAAYSPCVWLGFRYRIGRPLIVRDQRASERRN